MRHVLRWLPALTAAIVIYYYSITPLPAAEPSAGTGLFSLTLLHGIAYFGLAILIHLGFRLDYERIWAAVALAILFGTAIEFHQIVVPGRYFGVIDLAANATGATLMLLHPALPVFRVQAVQRWL